MQRNELFFSKRVELLMVTNAMLSGKVNLIEGVRKLCSLRTAVGEAENKIFMPIRAIDSETDHFPIGDMRSHCSVEYLAKMDAEMEKYLLDAKTDILSSCKKIVQFFG